MQAIRKGRSAKCPFCDAGCLDSSKVWYDQSLLSTPHFTVLPSVGALVPGWTLVAPKKHFLSMGAIPRQYRLELKDLLGRVTSILQHGFGKTVQFEHGPATHKSQIGCGLDHAHIHVVPIDFDLIGAAKSDSAIVWSDFGSGLHEIPKQRDDYLAIADHASSLIGYPNRPISQYFRKLIAIRLGIPDQFDYTKFGHFENVRITAQVVSKLAQLEHQARGQVA